MLSVVNRLDYLESNFWPRTKLCFLHAIFHFFHHPDTTNSLQKHPIQVQNNSCQNNLHS